MSIVCNNCAGLGQFVGLGGMKHKCSQCEGTGYVQDSKKNDADKITPKKKKE